MLAKLETSRLNVQDKNRSNLFNWRGQFTPQFIDYLLETYARPGQLVLDPFCGSGTVLQEAISHRLSSIGLEINPAAYAMARFFSLSSLSLATRRLLVENARELLRLVTSGFKQNLPLFQDLNNYRESASNLLDLARKIIKETEDKQIKLLLILSLFRAENTKNGELIATVNRSFQFLSDQLLRLPLTDKAPVVALSDARNSHLLVSNEVDIVMTSPPYINVFNYHQNHRALLEIIGFDMLKVAHSEMGSNRKNRGNRFLTVIQYCLDIELALNSFSKALASNGLLIMVLGRESRVRGISFSNSRIVSDLIEASGAFTQTKSYERVFVNRFGQSIFEDILVVRCTCETNDSKHGRNIAISFLKKAADLASGEVQTNIEEALALADSIQPSPFFNKYALI